jgi:hypothetical protein
VADYPILGTFEVIFDGETLRLGLPKQCALRNDSVKVLSLDRVDVRVDAYRLRSPMGGDGQRARHEGSACG